jgi:hypothetical protein
MTKDMKMELALFTINWLSGFGMGLVIAKILTQ